MCGIAAGTTAANFSKRNLKPIDIKIIAHELNSSRSMAPMEVLDISNNAIGVDGAKALVSALPDSNIKTLTFGPKSTKINLQIDALEPEPEEAATSVSFSNQELGPAELIFIAYWLSCDSTAGVESMDVSGNPITGGKHQQTGRTTWVTTIGDDIEGISALSTALSKIKNLVISDCGLGPKHLTVFAAALSSDCMAPSMESVDLSNNRFDPVLLKDIKNVKLSLAGCRP